ncbi:NAC domain-containing protein 18-like isoform X1 [Sesamum indicum]|uniref:NAC domain-containing protein 18-like isoform X1 n=1 Tax=Sesamum indicum TaxID=4182 RepID=A0A8M8V752_SESIN|nr:NAC domain-containing protein 18-like isoform X1 [Sesamum indicum]
MGESPIPNIQYIQYPPGIRFHPSDEELITYYLQRKVKSLPLPADMITDIELYSYNPWDLPRNSLSGGKEWYFFTPRDRKYPNGGRPNRTAASGYWKATGIDKPILSSTGSRRIGVKRDLVFYKGKPPKGLKMDWAMTEYRLPDATRTLSSKGSMRAAQGIHEIVESYSFQKKGRSEILHKLDDWVLCRLKQKGNTSKNAHEDDQNSDEFLEYLPKIEELPSVYTENSADMLENNMISSEYHLIDSSLVGHDPGVATIPRTTFQSHGSGNSSTTICEPISGKWNTQTTFSLFQSFSGSVPGKLMEENRCTNIQQPTNMIINEQTPVASRSGQVVATTGTNSYHQHVSEGNRFGPNYSPHAYINLQELDMPALSENFLQQPTFPRSNPF